MNFWDMRLWSSAEAHFWHKLYSCLFQPEARRVLRWDLMVLSCDHRFEKGWSCRHWCFTCHTLEISAVPNQSFPCFNCFCCETPGEVGDHHHRWLHSLQQGQPGSRRLGQTLLFEAQEQRALRDAPGEGLRQVLRRLLRPGGRQHHLGHPGHDRRPGVPWIGWNAESGLRGEVWSQRKEYNGLSAKFFGDMIYCILLVFHFSFYFLLWITLEVSRVHGMLI